MSQPFKLSDETSAALALLVAAPPGGVVSYDALSAAVGADARGEGKGRVDYARKIARRDHGRVFDAVENVGLLCLPPEGVVRKGGRRREKVRRQAVLTLKEYDTISRALPALSDVDRAEYVANRTLAAALINEASARTAESRRVAIMNNVLPAVAPDLGAFRGS